MLTLRIRSELVREFGLFAVRGVRLVKIEDRSIVLRGWLNNEQVIFKKYPGPNAADIVARAADELRFLETNLKPPFFANRCIATAPAIGVIVLSWVPGKPVRRALIKASATERKEILRLVGGWLGCCVDLRSSNLAMRPQMFLRRLRKLSTQEMSSEDHVLIARMLDELGRLASLLQGVRVPHTIAHGDLTQMNMFHSRGEIHAIDINGAGWLPVMWMAARFLVAKDLAGPLSRAELFHGVDALDAGLFMDTAGDQGVQKHVLRFFIGAQMVKFFLGRNARRERNTHVRDRIVAFLTTSVAHEAGKPLP